MSAVGTGTSLRDKELDPEISCFNSASSFCARAICSKSMVGDGTVIALVAIQDSAPATGLSLVWAMSVVNWDI